MQAFSPLRILEIAEGVAGPVCALQLADLGATVVKIEPPAGDRARAWGPLLADGSSAIFAHLNRGKQSIVLDVTTEHGREALHNLLPAFDVMIVQLDPAARAECAIDWASLTQRFPHLVVCELDDLGPQGPLANLPGSELTLQAMSGFTRYIGEPGGAPCRIGFEIAWMAAGMHACHAVLAALYFRARSGEGQYVRVTALKALLSLKTLLFAAQSGGTDAWNGFHLNGPRWPPDTGWHTRDGQITFDFRHGERAAWVAFCEKVGLGHLPEHPDYKDWRSTIYIGDRRYQFGKPYQEVFTRMSCEQASGLINSLGGISVKFNDYAELLAHPQVKALSALVQVSDAAEGARIQVGVPFKLDGKTAMQRFRRAPRLGEHNEQVPAPGSAAAVQTPRPAPRCAVRPAAPTGPLQGLRILDASQGAVGPWAGTLLGELGADVVKLESPQGDFIRAVMPAKRGLSTTYISCNFNKRGIVLDLKDAQARRKAHELVRQADVFIENFRPGVAARIGVGYEELARINSRLIYASASAFGAVGPLAAVGGTDPHIQPFSGSCSVNGMPGGKRERWRWYGHFDMTTGLVILYGVLAALIEREATGKGRLVEVTMVEAAMALQRVRLAEHLGGGEPKPMGSAITYLVPDQAFATQDRPVAVSATSACQWRSLCRAIGQPELADDERFATHPARLRNRDSLLAILEDAFKARPAQYWLEVLRAQAVPCALFTSFDDFRYHVHYLENGMLRSFDTPRWGRLYAGGIPWQFAKTPCELWPGKLAGECTAEIFEGGWPPLGCAED